MKGRVTAYANKKGDKPYKYVYGYKKIRIRLPYRLGVWLWNRPLKGADE